jgi:hypothetical protein
MSIHTKHLLQELAWYAMTVTVWASIGILLALGV